MEVDRKVKFFVENRVGVLEYTFICSQSVMNMSFV